MEDISSHVEYKLLKFVCLKFKLTPFLQFFLEKLLTL